MCLKRCFSYLFNHLDTKKFTSTFKFDKKIYIFNKG